MNPAILGLAGTQLSSDEKAFFRSVNPFGFIIFSRNIETPQQMKRLTHSLRECVGREHVAILIDQEGGAVQRLGPPHWRKAPPMALFGNICLKSADLALRAAVANAALMGAELMDVGVTVNCLPVLDVLTPEADDIIGGRAFSSDPSVVSTLGAATITGLAKAGIVPVIKHIPGHGRAKVDSHKQLPIVEAPLSELQKTDFIPFAYLHDAPMAMTAHIAYSAIDPGVPATFSKPVIKDVIRGLIDFQGLLLSDDLGMSALQGNFRDRTTRSLNAGVDVVLHCSGILDEMEDIVAGAGSFSSDKLRNWDVVLKTANQRVTVDLSQASAVWKNVEEEVRSVIGKL